MRDPTALGARLPSPSDIDMRDRGNAQLARDRLDRLIERSDEAGLAAWARQNGPALLEGLNHGFGKASTRW